LQRHVARVVHFHAKDARPEMLRRARVEDMSFMGAVLEGIFTVPGDGFIDYPPLLRILHEAGYAGWLVVEAEQDPRKAHPLTYASLGRKNLQALAVAAGFTVEDPA
jgi:inosose dehydratase